MKGILFKPNMIKAVMEGRKTQTRRLAEDVNDLASQYDHCWTYFDKKDNWWLLKGRSRITDAIEPFVIKPRYLPGETVYVKEAWATLISPDDTITLPVWKLGFETVSNGTEPKWHSPLMMPEKYARTKIKILDARPERLNCITNEDALREGVSRHLAATLGLSVPESEEEFNLTAARRTFKALWDSINKKNPWSSNPWVWKYTFEKVKQ